MRLNISATGDKTRHKRKRHLSSAVKDIAAATGAPAISIKAWASFPFYV
jgi:hypothetical protein